MAVSTDIFPNLRASIGYILRFIHNCRNKEQRKTDVLSLEEIWESEIQLFKFIQSETFNGIADEKLSYLCTIYMKMAS